MAQNENYSQVDLRVGTEEQFNAKVGTLPAGTLFGITDSTVSKADLSTDLKNEINGKYTKPTDGIPETDLAGDVQTSLAKANSALQSHQTVKLESGTNNGTLKLTVNGTATDNIAVTNLGSAAFTATSNYATAAQGAKADNAIQKPSTPTTESAITINSSGTISTKPLTSITGKSEVAVQSTTPTGDEILWINPNGTGGGGSGGGKLYRHNIVLNYSNYDIVATLICYTSTENSFTFYDLYTHTGGSCAVGYKNVNVGNGSVLMTMTADQIDDQKFNINLSGAIDENNGSSAVIVNTDYTTKGSGDILQLTDTVLEV